MNLNKLKNKWKNSVVSGNVLSLLEKMQSDFDFNSEKRNELYLVIARYNQVNKSYGLGAIKYEDFIQEVSRLTSLVLNLIDRVNIEDLRQDIQEEENELNLSKENIIKLIESHLENIKGEFTEINIEPTKIKNNLLIVSSESGIQPLKSYFNNRRFESVEFAQWNNFKLFDFHHIEVVIFNNMDVTKVDFTEKPGDPRSELMIKAIKSNKCYFINYGKFSRSSYNYDNLIFATSIFDLVSTVKNIVEFVNLYKINLTIE